MPARLLNCTEIPAATYIREFARAGLPFPLGSTFCTGCPSTVDALTPLVTLAVSPPPGSRPK